MEVASRQLLHVRLKQITCTCAPEERKQYCKTPLMSTYVFFGSPMVQVLILGGHIFFRGCVKAGCKVLQGRRLFNPVLYVDSTLLCRFQRLCSNTHDTGVLKFGGMYFQGIAANSKFK